MVSIGRRKGFEVVLPTSGGKAGKGKQKTTCLQILRDNRIVKQFRFVVGDEGSKNRAVQRAENFMDQNGGE